MKTWETRSKSNPSAKPHVSTHHDGGELTCTCPGWTQLRNGKPRYCTHLKKYVADNGLNVTQVGDRMVVEGAMRQAITVAKATKLLDDFARVAKAVAPDPMLASVMLDPVKGKAYDKRYADGWIQEEKMNGHRVMVVIDKSGTVTALSRPSRGKPALERTLPPHILEALKPLSSGIYDGELLVPGGKHWNVNETRFASKLMLCLFDIVKAGNDSLVNEPYLVRRTLLLNELANLDSKQMAITTVESREPSWAEVEEIWARDGEGVILKRVDGKYDAGARSPEWVKVKKLLPALLTVVGYDKGERGPYSTICLVDSEEHPARVKTVDEATLRAIAANPGAFINRKLWIEHQGRTPKGAYQHPMFDHWDGE